MNCRSYLAIVFICSLLSIGCAQKVLKGERYKLPAGVASAIFPVKPTAVEKSYFGSFQKSTHETLALAFAPEPEDGSIRILSEKEFEGALRGTNGGYIMTLSSYSNKESSRQTFEEWQKDLAGTQHLYSKFTTDQGKTWKWFKESYPTRETIMMQATFTYVTDKALVVAVLRGPYTDQFVEEFGKSLRVE